MLTGDTQDLQSELLTKLRQVANRWPVDLVITSGYREGDLKSAHGYGFAADLRITGGFQRKQLALLTMKFFTRVGVYPKHIHVDIDRSRPQDVLWAGCYHPRED